MSKRQESESKNLKGLPAIVSKFLLGALTLSSVNSGGCVYLAHSFYSRQNQNYKGAFACNYWKDKNRNSIAELGEFEGIKKYFYSRESITLVNIIHGRKGDSLSCNVFNPAGKLVHHFDKIILFDRNVTRAEFSPRELRELGGKGKYNVNWRLNGNLINQHYFYLLD